MIHSSHKIISDGQKLLDFFILAEIGKSKKESLILLMNFSSIYEFSICQDRYIELGMNYEVCSANINNLCAFNLVIPVFLIADMNISEKIEDLVRENFERLQFYSQKWNRRMVRVIFTVHFHMRLSDQKLISIIVILNVHEFLYRPVQILLRSCLLSLV